MTLLLKEQEAMLSHTVKVLLLFCTKEEDYSLNLYQAKESVRFYYYPDPQDSAEVRNQARRSNPHWTRGDAQTQMEPSVANGSVHTGRQEHQKNCPLCPVWIGPLNLCLCGFRNKPVPVNAAATVQLFTFGVVPESARLPGRVP